MGTTIKILFSFLVAIHGLIHLMGFAKAFGFAEMSQLTQPISKLQGMAWLVAALLFSASIPAYLLRKDWWWMIAFVAIVISQLVIFLSWKDAKFGTLANVIILIVIILGYGKWS